MNAQNIFFYFHFLIGLLTGVFITLKLTSLVSWPWAAVFSPSIILGFVYAAIISGYLFVQVLTKLNKNIDTSAKKH